MLSCDTNMNKWFLQKHLSLPRPLLPKSMRTRLSHKNSPLNGCFRKEEIAMLVHIRHGIPGDLSSQSHHPLQTAWSMNLIYTSYHCILCTYLANASASYIYLRTSSILFLHPTLFLQLLPSPCSWRNRADRPSPLSCGEHGRTHLKRWIRTHGISNKVRRWHWTHIPWQVKMVVNARPNTNFKT